MLEDAVDLAVAGQLRDGSRPRRPRWSGPRFFGSQTQEAWRLLPRRYDDAGLSGGTLDRPALQRLLHDIDSGHDDVMVDYNVDRLTRSLADFAKRIERCDKHGASRVPVTQRFNTNPSMERLTLDVLWSFARFERKGIDKAQVIRWLRPTILAPTLARRVQAGTHPASLTIEALLRQVDLPEIWQEQEALVAAIA